MCNGTWVCFDCRMALRRPTWRLVGFLCPWLIGDIGEGNVRCPKCRQACCFLGPTIEIPPKRDLAAWKRLRERIQSSCVAAQDRRFKQMVRRRHDLEQRIRELESKPANRDRAGVIKVLRAKLAAG